MSSFLLPLRQKIGDWLNSYTPNRNDGSSFRGPLADKRSVLIVTALASDSDKETLANLKHEVKAMCPNAQISILGYCPDPKNSPISDNNQVFITPKDISFFFKLNSPTLSTLLNSTFDIAIILNGDNYTNINYIAKFIHAYLRVGQAGSALDTQGILNFVVEAKDSHEPISVKSCLQMVFDN